MTGINNFHDASYHTSEDTPRFLDPTQMKRAGFIGLAMGQVMANATGSDAVTVATLSAAYGQRRLGEDLTGAVMMIAEATTGEAAHRAYKEARNRMQWAHRREKVQVHSAVAMIGGDQKALAQLKRVEDAVAASENIDLERVKAAYLAKCAALDLEPILDPPLSTEEQEAGRLIPEKKTGVDQDLMVFTLTVRPQILQRCRLHRPDFVVNQPWPAMLVPGFPKCRTRAWSMPGSRWFLSFNCGCVEK